jgi:putative DNA primase/helicase
MAMDAVSQIIAKLGAKIRILKIPEDKPRAWDVADATLVDGWKLPEILAFIRQTMGEVIAPDAPGPAGNPPPAPESPPTEPPDTQEWPFRCLGYDAGYHYYLPIGTRQVRAIRGEAHTSSALLDLANLKFWERSFPGPTGPAWKYAANAMLRTNETIGVYDAMRQRGRGAWYDSGRSVLHLGDRLIVDGKAQSIHELRSRFIYEAAPPLEFTEAIPLPNSEAVKLQRIIDMLFWAKPIYAKLCAGWCVIAPVCGALIYRPHIWITASPGSGKTFIIENIIKPCLGEFSLAVSSKTTEAGIRQTLRNDALAVIIDEFEGEDYLSQINIQKILDLARQSFSNSSTRIVKGGQNGHATAYNIRSCFFMSSVGVNLSQHADETRISVLELEEPYDRDNKSKHENFKQLQDDVTNILTEDFCAGLRARAINYVQILQKNSSVFSLVVSQLLGNQRAGDQVGALLAGAHLLVSDKAITFEQAQEWVNKQDWEDQREVTEKSDGMECLNAIFHHVAKTNSNQEKSIIEMLIECRNNIPISGEESDEGMILRRHGIRYVRSENRVYISEYHPGLKRILKNSAWPKCWGRTLARIPGAIRKISMRFYGPPTRAVGIPFEDSWVD